VGAITIEVRRVEVSFSVAISLRELESAVECFLRLLDQLHPASALGRGSI
jgi:hypothetical protein